MPCHPILTFHSPSPPDRGSRNKARPKSQGWHRGSGRRSSRCHCPFSSLLVAKEGPCARFDLVTARPACYFWTLSAIGLVAEPNKRAKSLSKLPATVSCIPGLRTYYRPILGHPLVAWRKRPLGVAAQTTS
ncbi:hypothetical protein M440DRAFT_135449 [Trichoderma longibrachiatum ATCC 18648]|uniref:Uncharacterized protein n=1 Tax=Trichoderma longibrachiatum ATCC 18648 TaxID=983965 RepID=A0A2T4BWD8_TRILO|nr:hypothetical protein M440DRAFT_135449 [Trichoderma longibrachiatum ATCC 18648]